MMAYTSFSITKDSFHILRLYFGCQLSKETFFVLWKAVNVGVDFGIGTRKLQFFLSHEQVEYQLELSYENIWQIELRRPRGEIANYLLIQLLGAPRIFKEENYQWIRATDFTPLGCIGQSSALCLELAYGEKFPNLNFPFYKESEKHYTLENGFPFSSSWDLVPIVASPPGNEIPYDILFKINSLVQHGCLAGPALDIYFYQLVDPLTIPRPFIEHALEKIYHSKEFCYEPSRWLIKQYKKYRKSKHHLKSPAISLDDGLVYVRRVQITPCKVYFRGPEVNISNRVLRHFHEHIDNFLRVSFVDEESEKMYSKALSVRISSSIGDRKTELYERILSVLRYGIDIGEKKFEFLAFSKSQLKETSLWMFAPTRNGITAAYIRKWMGNFRKIKNVAKYAARLGQSFSSSTETLSVPQHEIEMIPDVEVSRDGTQYVFSDGIGKISKKFARKVAIKCGHKSFTPSAFQIRYGGFKGVVAVDPTSSVKLSLRKSMLKYESDNTKLDVLAWSKYQPCYLNRQIITLLSTLGVEDHVFEEKQKEAINRLNTILTDSLKAREALDLMSAGEMTNILKGMLTCGYEPEAEPFLSMMLQTYRASKLLDLRLKARIFIPDGRAMMGCLDETRTLKYGQVFVQFSGNRQMQLFDDTVAFGPARSCIVTGNVVVAKNPCLHPGDVRVLSAVNVPALHHMVDCVVFPQKGSRPHPNECSGSDLDGDIYFVCWDQELIPPYQIEPMDYTPLPSMQLDHEVTMEEVEEYFANYIVNDNLGLIANAHTAFADKEFEKAMSSPCLELAELHSEAVDFPKTGVPAVIPRHLYVKEYPDFMEKGPDKSSYTSRNVIGKLFREVRDIAPYSCSTQSFTQEMAKLSYDLDMEVDGFMDYVDDAFYYKTNYDYKLGNLMDFYGIETEAEILIGNVVRLTKRFDKRRDAEAVNRAVKSLKKEARTWFNENLDSGTDNLYAKASAWYHVTYHPSYWGCYNEGMNRPHFLSFPWCVYDKLVQIKEEKREEAFLHLSSLEHDFSDGFYLD